MMNAKGFILFVLVIVFFSCKREKISYHRNGGEAPVSISGVSSKSDYEMLASTQMDDRSYLISTIEKINNKEEVKVEKVIQYTESKKDSVPSANGSKREIKRSIKESKQIKKEMDPRLSRSLWMTIFGGIATTLGIIFMGYAPTGLFVFAFGIVFLVGVVSLIMYLANPKPKM